MVEYKNNFSSTESLKGITEDGDFDVKYFHIFSVHYYFEIFYNY